MLEAPSHDSTARLFLRDGDLKRKVEIAEHLSHSGGLARLLGMRNHLRPSRYWLVAAVVAHLVISFVHGAAHSGARVLLSPAATLFVFVVILAGPVAGLALMWRAARLGASVVALTMAGALVFGIVNHFMLASADHVSHVDPAWRAMFTATAVLLALTESAGCGLAIAAARERRLLS